mgnify:CR=1 FL=1
MLTNLRRCALFWIILALLFVLNFQLHPSLYQQPEMWAEAGNNYYYHARHDTLWQNLLQDDYGYLPLLPRLFSLAVEIFPLPVAWIPWIYQWIALLFISACSAIFALPFFRFTLTSDTLRGLLWLSLALISDKPV